MPNTFNCLVISVENVQEQSVLNGLDEVVILWMLPSHLLLELAECHSSLL